MLRGRVPADGPARSVAEGRLQPRRQGRLDQPRASRRRAGVPERVSRRGRRGVLSRRRAPRGECCVDIPWRRVAATPRPGRGHSVEMRRGDAAAGTRGHSVEMRRGDAATATCRSGAVGGSSTVDASSARRPPASAARSPRSSRASCTSTTRAIFQTRRRPGSTWSESPRPGSGANSTTSSTRDGARFQKGSPRRSRGVPPTRRAAAPTCPSPTASGRARRTAARSSSLWRRRSSSNSFACRASRVRAAGA